MKKHFIKKGTFGKTIFFIKKSIFAKTFYEMNIFINNVKLLVVFLEK